MIRYPHSPLQNPALHLSNLQVITGARVRRILINQGRATGVEYSLGRGPSTRPG
ncbi:GMC family oxidoreductase N-terminal domain-containing protein [Pseudomonas sp.]|uniref:GMC family oxidoreductase N-terminal domain-containing protein n=1 Tax=Pseudomonas sp. TaxID=306 RepID=UPI002625D084|nr:GMC family oxidoreductase N-terminal domain-containing protein [Pseudomonas sp.]